MDLNGKIIVIEGTDGSGKQTQAQMLKEKLESLGYNVFSTSFPKYDSDSSAAVKMYLNGQIKSNAEDVSAKAASIFFAVDRYITYKKEIEEVYSKKDSVIILDRYTNSNIIHQGAKLLNSDDVKSCDLSNENKEKLKEFTAWLYNLEHRDFEIPKADITIYLNVPIDYVMNMIADRKNKINGEDKKDIHESNIDYLKKTSKVGEIASKMLGWEVIECVEDGKMKSREDIAEKIWERIKIYAKDT